MRFKFSSLGRMESLVLLLLWASTLACCHGSTSLWQALHGNKTNLVEPPLPSVVSKANHYRPKATTSAPPPRPNWEPPPSLNILKIMVITMVAVFGTVFVCAILWTIVVNVNTPK